ncbi:MAG: ABC transporter ATP-binding protein [Bacillota bacterium]
MPPLEIRKNTSALPVLKNYLAALKNYPLMLSGLFLILLGVQAAEIASPLLLKHFIDLVAGNNVTHLITSGVAWSLTFYALALFVSWVFYRFLMLFQNQIEARVQRDLLNKAFAYLVYHDYDFFINNFAGTLTRRITRYARAFQQVFQSIAINIIPTAIFTVGVIVVLSLRNAWLGIGLLIWTIFFVLLQFFMTRWRYQYKLERSAQDSRLTGALSDSIGNHTAALFFAAERHEMGRIAGVLADWYDATVRAWTADMWNYAVQGLVTRIAQIVLLVVALYLWQQGQFTIGDIILIQVYMLSLMDRVGVIGSTMRQLYDAYAEANEMIEIFNEPHGITDLPGATPLMVSKGEIVFDSVRFSFMTDRSILENFNLSIAHNEKVALVGPSGAGKSTITKLLLRLYDVDSGAITIDGTKIRGVTQESLRQAIAFVPQEPVLFHRTLRENIAYGRQDASLEEVIEAAKKAHCHEFISQLPYGYDTYVGERGVKLSGGERQRVAIARAILKNAPILVLDEATSSLDSESEHYIQEALDTLMEGKTVIVIAHRLSTIMKMDRIIVMEHGSIVAEGTHQQLLTEDGLYAKLWSIQAGGFLGGQEENHEESIDEEVPE